MANHKKKPPADVTALPRWLLPYNVPVFAVAGSRRNKLWSLGSEEENIERKKRKELWPLKIPKL